MDSVLFSSENETCVDTHFLEYQLKFEFIEILIHFILLCFQSNDWRG